MKRIDVLFWKKKQKEEKNLHEKHQKGGDDELFKETIEIGNVIQTDVI